MKSWLDKLGYVAFGIVAGAILRGMFDQERRRIASSSRKPSAVAAVRG